MNEKLERLRSLIKQCSGKEKIIDSLEFFRNYLQTEKTDDNNYTVIINVFSFISAFVRKTLEIVKEEESNV